MPSPTFFCSTAIAVTLFLPHVAAAQEAPQSAGGAAIFAGDATGNRLPLAQNFSGTVAVDYHHELPRGALDFNVSANHNGDYFFEADNNLRQGAYTILNLSLRWTLPGDQVSLTVFARNLLDEQVITQATTQALGYPAAYSNTPRSFGAAVQVKF